MLRARLFVGLAMGMSLLAVGCGGSSIDDPLAILNDFRADNRTALQKYQGKTVRLRVAKVTSVGKSGRAMEHVTVQGQVGKILIDATVSDPAEQSKALALKVGEPATFEGEAVGGMGELPGMGAVFIKVKKVKAE